MAHLAAVAGFFHRHGLADRPGVIAVSGGPDSVALVHACLTIEPPLAAVLIAHLNHQLRGPASDADEAFVRNLPQVWNRPSLRCISARIDVAARARDRGDNLENAAREARYEWLTEIARQTDACWIATGHTADDQAETLLLHFLRGSGLTGLAGMAERRFLAPGIELVRPMLSVRRAEVMAYLAEHRLAHCTDASNDDAAFTRNRLRHELIPLLQRDFNPAVIDVLGRTALQLRDIQEELTRQAAALLSAAERPRAGRIVVLARPALEVASVVIVRELLRLIWQREGWPTGHMGFADWDRAATLARGATGGQHFPDGVQVRPVGQVIQLERM